MNTNQLFTLASSAKNCGDYLLANEIFAVLAHMSISRTADVYIGYEQNPGCDDIVENLFDKDGAGYYDLPFLFDSDGNYLCIPLPLVSRHFCNHIVWNCIKWQDREEDSHNRNHWRLGHKPQNAGAAHRDLRRRFHEIVDESYRDMAIDAILQRIENDIDLHPPTFELAEQYLGPATLSKLTSPILPYDEYELELEEA